MRTILYPACLLFLALVVLACADRTEPEPPPLGTAESFTWAGGQPIAFSLPPADWDSSRYQNGGTEGVDFVKRGSGGEQILVAERLYVGARDRCTRLQHLQRQLGNQDRTGFSRDLLEAKLYAQEPFNPGEARTIDIVNASLDRARRAHDNDNLSIVQFELNAAYAQARKVRFTIDETVGQALFTAERNTVYPNVVVEAPSKGKLAGEDAVVVDFSFDAHGVPFLGRRVYAVKNNRMFELGFQGRAENLPLFERILDTVEFPSGPCEH